MAYRQAKERGVKTDEGIAKLILEDQETVSLGLVRRLKQDNIYVNLNNKCKNGLLPLIDLEWMRDMIIEGVEGNIKFYHT